MLIVILAEDFAHPEVDRRIINDKVLTLFKPKERILSMYSDPTISDLLPLFILNGIVLALYLLHVTIFRNHHHFKELRDDKHSMILSLRIKEFWYWITTPIFKFFVRFKVQPNTISTIGFLLSVTTAFFFARGYIATAGWLMVLAGSMDFFDGRVARHLKLETKSGAFYDSILDRLAEGIVFLGLLIMYADHWMYYVVFFGFLMSMMISYTKAKGEIYGVDVKVGIMQRPERIAYIGAPSMLWPMVYVLFEPWFPILEYDFGTRVGLILVLVLSVQTFFVRFKKVFISLGGGRPRHH